MKEDKFAKLKRSRYPIPEYVKEALEEHALVKAFEQRPAYQQNDYIGANAQWAWKWWQIYEDAISLKLAISATALIKNDTGIDSDYHIIKWASQQIVGRLWRVSGPLQ